MPAVQLGVRPRVAWELSIRIVDEEDRARRERLLITMAHVIGRTLKLTEDGNTFVSSD